MQLKGENARFVKSIASCTNMQNLEGWRGWFHKVVEMHNANGKHHYARVAGAILSAVEQRIAELA